MVDAKKTDFDDLSFDFVIRSGMIHHTTKPKILLDKIYRILKHGSLLLVQEIRTSLVTKILLRAMQHKGWDDTIDVVDPKVVCNDPRDLWSSSHSDFSDVIFLASTGKSSILVIPNF
jgi:ubiquinone/menaquinone biosynthesis C-methylase UbiE